MTLRTTGGAGLIGKDFMIGGWLLKITRRGAPNKKWGRKKKMAIKSNFQPRQRDKPHIANTATFTPRLPEKQNALSG